jgi:LysM repeat protein
MFAIIGGSLLTIVLVIALVLVNKPAQGTEVTPTEQAILTPTHTPMPTLIQTDFLASTPAISETFLQPSEYFEYVVTHNDTCAIIAANFNVSVEAILEKNNLSPSCTLTGEQKLLIPFFTSEFTCSATYLLS